MGNEPPYRARDELHHDHKDRSMNDDRIFGYEWQDVLRVQQQQGSLTRDRLDFSKPGGPKPATDEDRNLLEACGSMEALVSAGFTVSWIDCGMRAKLTTKTNYGASHDV